MVFNINSFIYFAIHGPVSLFPIFSTRIAHERYSRSCNPAADASVHQNFIVPPSDLFFVLDSSSHLISDMVGFPSSSAPGGDQGAFFGDWTVQTTRELGPQPRGRLRRGPLLRRPLRGRPDGREALQGGPLLSLRHRPCLLSFRRGSRSRVPTQTHGLNRIIQLVRIGEDFDNLVRFGYFGLLVYLYPYCCIV